MAAAVHAGEPQLLIRAGRVRVARLARALSGEVLSPPAGVLPWRLEITTPGVKEVFLWIRGATATVVLTTPNGSRGDGPPVSADVNHDPALRVRPA